MYVELGTEASWVEIQTSCHSQIVAVVAKRQNLDLVSEVAPWIRVLF